MITLTNWLPALVEAFTLYGGGGKGGASTPKTPDYEKLAITQAELDRQAAERNVLANRANQNTPWGNISWSSTPVTGEFDQAGYDAAMADYNARLAAGSGYGRPSRQNYAGNNSMYALYPNYNRAGTQQGSYGTQMPTRDAFTTGAGGSKWTQNVTLNPDDQARLEAQQKSQRALAEGAQGMLGRINDAYSTEFNWNDAPDVRQVDLGALPEVWNADWTSATGENGGMAIDKVKEAIMSRIAPDLLRNRQREEAQMIAQGVGRGANEAWGKSQTTLGRNETDAAMQALLQGIGEYGNIRDDQLGWRQNVYGEQGDQYNRDVLDRDRYLKEQKARRDLPMDEYMRLMGASGEVQMPQFPGYANMGSPNAANLTGAAQDTYNSKMQAANASNQANSNFWNTAVSLGGLGASIFSDPRLKTDVKFLGMHPLGIGIYSWVYRWGQKAIGVMADELLMVKPEAVGVRNGYLTVDYGRL